MFSWIGCLPDREGSDDILLALPPIWLIMAMPCERDPMDQRNDNASSDSCRILHHLLISQIPAFSAVTLLLIAGGRLTAWGP